MIFLVDLYFACFRVMPTFRICLHVFTFLISFNHACLFACSFLGTSSTAQGGGRSFKNRKPMRSWLLRGTDGRAKTLMDRQVFQVPSLSLSSLPKVVQAWCALCIFTPKCASLHNSAQVFDIRTSKNGPRMVCFEHLTGNVLPARPP